MIRLFRAVKRSVESSVKGMDMFSTSTPCNVPDITLASAIFIDSHFKICTIITWNSIIFCVYQKHSLLKIIFFFRYCLKCCHEEEFFIRKAIGWALREYFRADPKSVKEFVKNNETKLSNLSKREALKHA